MRLHDQGAADLMLDPLEEVFIANVVLSQSDLQADLSKSG
jgi:hypothetical protein